MLRDLAQLLLGETCPGCARPALATTAEPRSRWCRPCAAAMVPDVRIDTLDRWPVASAFDYAAVPRHSIVEWKSHQAKDVHTVMVDVLAETVLTLVTAHLGGGPVTLVPVPTSSRSRRERGIALVEVLAREAARRVSEVGVPVTSRRALALRRTPRDQVQLNAAQRWSNVADSMRVCAVPPGRVVVVDDIVTTGATVAEAVGTLVQGGVDVAGIASIARSQRALKDLSAVTVADDPAGRYGREK